MSFTINALLSKKDFKDISVVTGKKGLNRTVSSIQIADYEFSEGYKYDKGTTFLKDGIVISSLLFALNNEKILLEAVKDFIEAGSAALLYKTVLFEDLPDNVIEYAESKNFPVLKFKDMYFEDIIYNLMDLLYNGDNGYLSDETIQGFIDNKASKYDIEKAAKEVALQFKQYAVGLFLVTDDRECFNPLRINKCFQMDSYLKPRAITFGYKNGLFVLITAQSENEEPYSYIIDYILDRLFIERNKISYYMSKVHRPFEELDKCFRESYFTFIASLAAEEYYRRYSDIGLYRFLIPLKDRHSMSAFSDDFISKIADYPELINTLKLFVRNKGSVVGTAVDSGCHENTVRYRLGKISELLGMDNHSSYELYEHASLAIKINDLKKLDSE